MTVIVENTVSRKDLHSEHGLSCWIETEDGNLLWDTGQTDLVLRNAHALGIALQSTSHLALSHGHYDHTGGLIQALRMAPHATVYGHPDLFVKRYIKTGHSTKPIGSLAERDTVEDMCESLILSCEPVEILPGIYTTGQIPRKTNFEDTEGDFFLDEECTLSDPIIDDQALYMKTAEGTVVILGCAHAGVVNTLNYVSELTNHEKMYAVFGGMHLKGASQERLESTADAFARNNIKMIGPCYCTGKNAMTYFRTRFPDQFVECMTGSHFTFEGIE